MDYNNNNQNEKEDQDFLSSDDVFGLRNDVYFDDKDSDEVSSDLNEGEEIDLSDDESTNEDENKDVLEKIEDLGDLDDGDSSVDSTSPPQLNLEQKDEDDDDAYAEEEKSDDGIIVSKSKLAMVKKLLENIKDSHDKILGLLPDFGGDENLAKIKISQLDSEINKTEEEGGKIIEGVFDGQNMIGPDGKQYSVPANYASKSKIVEGDIMKLTITGGGTFVYKQIGPVDRAREVGILEKDEEGNFVVVGEDARWRILPASITYFKGEIGDEVVLLVPRLGTSKWAAVENVVKKSV